MRKVNALLTVAAHTGWMAVICAAIKGFFSPACSSVQQPLTSLTKEANAMKKAKILCTISVALFVAVFLGSTMVLFLPSILEAQADELNAKVGTFTAISGTGNQSVTGVSFQPKAVLFWITDRTSVGSGAPARFGRGWTDGTNEGAIATAWSDGSSTTSVASRAVNTKAITLIDDDGTTVLAEADIVSFDSDGFTINWSTAGGSRIVGYLALGGDALTNVKAGSYSDTAPSLGTQRTVTGVGFQPDAVLMMGYENEPFGSNTRGQATFGVGISSTNRHAVGWRQRYQVSGDGTDGSSGLDSQHIFVPGDDRNTPEIEIDLVSMDSGGFTYVYDTTTGDGRSIPILYLALKGMDIARGVLTQPTSTGNQSVTGLTFKPSVVLFDGGDKATGDGFEQNAEYVTGAAISSTSRFGIWIGHGDPTGSTSISDTDLSTSAVIRSLSAGTPTVNAVADFVSRNSNGFTIDWTTADATARKIGWIALGPSPGSVTVTGTDIAPSWALPGDTDVGMEKLSLVTDAGTATWTQVKVDLTGTDVVDGDISSVEIWKDDGDGSWEGSGQDTQIGSGSFSSKTVTIDITDQSLTTSSQTFYVVYDIASGAVETHTAGAKLLDNSYITVSSPASVSSSNFPIQTSGDMSLPVELSSFTASASDGKVTLHWHTESEVDNAWFYIYRSQSQDGEYVRLPVQIEGAGSSPTSRQYQYVDKGLTNGVTYWYKLEDVDLDGTKTMHGPILATPYAVGEESVDLPEEYGLSQSYPNPFNPGTVIEYRLPEDGYVTLRVYDALGHPVRTLVDGDEQAGYKSVWWDGGDDAGGVLGSGVYFCRLEVGGRFVGVRKMVIMR